METEWSRTKEKEKVQEKEIKACEEKAAEQLKEIQRLQMIESGKDNNYQRVLQNAQEEVLQEQALIREKKECKQAFWKVKWTQKLAEEVSRLKNEEIREQKRRQLLRSTSVELRQLEEELRTAYAAKTLQVQLKEKEAIRTNTRCKELYEDKMIKGWYQNDNSEQENLTRLREKKECYRRDLQDQLIINYRKRQQKSEEEQKERKLTEEISQTLKEEDMEKEKEKKEIQARLREEEEAFIRARDMWRYKEKKALLEEHNRIERIIAEKENQQQKSVDIKAKKLGAKEIMMEKMSRRMLEKEMKKREHEDIINMLYEEEEKNSAETRLRNESLEKQRAAKDLLEDMVRQKKAIAERKVQNAAVDKAFAQYIEKQNQIASKQEQEKQETRRRLGLCYGEDLRKAVMDERISYAENILRKQTSMRNDEKLDAIRQQEISVERSRMLQEHASQLQGFLKMEGTSNENLGNAHPQQAFLKKFEQSSQA